jgi:hypothetical protein
MAKKNPFKCESFEICMDRTNVDCSKDLGKHPEGYCSKAIYKDPVIERPEAILDHVGYHDDWEELPE